MKRKFEILIICLFFIPILHAQDVIFIKDGSEIKCKVVEIEDVSVKYKKLDQQDGPFRNINKADIFMIIYEDGTREVFAKPGQTEESLTQTTTHTQPASKSDSAILYVYRPGEYRGFALAYDLYVGDQKIGAVRNKSEFTFVFHQEGPVEVWAKTEKKVSIFLDIKFGEKYYIKCGVATGAWVGRPDLILVSSLQGEPEYKRIKGED